MVAGDTAPDLIRFPGCWLGPAAGRGTLTTGDTEQSARSAHHPTYGPSHPSLSVTS